jgi:hypothetical protein
MARAPSGISLRERWSLIRTILRSRDDDGDGSSTASQLDITAGLDRVEDRGEIRAGLGD